MQQRIALFSPAGSSGDAAHGGITTSITRLANFLVGRGFAVDLLVFPPRGRPVMLAHLDPRARIVDIQARHKATQWAALIHYAYKWRPTALLCAGHRCNLVGGWLRRTTGITRVILSVREAVSPGLARFSAGRRRRHLANMKRVYDWADDIVAVSAGAADDLARHSGLDRSRITVIYNPIAGPDLVERAAGPPAHPWLDDDATPVILAVGRLAAQKDFPTLLRAFRKVRDRRDCRLVILGEGPDRGALQALARELGVAEDVDLAGFSSQALAFMARASVVALSSAWEGFGNVIVEALAVGTPVVSTNCPSGPSEILDDGRYGALVPVGKPDALADALIATLDHPLPKETLRTRAGVFSVEASGTAFINVMGLAPASRKAVSP